MTALQILALALSLAHPAHAQTASSPKSAVKLDYEYFKERVQPIFLNRRPGHARCITCHDHGVPPLQPLSPGAANWTEEQSRKNFDMWKQFVVPGNPLKSQLLVHPLAHGAGGDHFHAGGKHWKSQSDPEWQTVAAWVRGQTMGDSK